MMIRSFIIFFCVFFLGACATSGTSKSSFGQKSFDSQDPDNFEILNQKPSGVIIVFDPNIPATTAAMTKLGVWPELRRAEANRFSVLLKNSIAERKIFDGLRIHPDNSSSANFYLTGKILKSDGMNIELAIKVDDVSGRSVLKRTYRHKVNEYVLNNRRHAGQDLYKVVFNKIAIDIEKVIDKQSSKRIAELKTIEKLNFAEQFSPEYFSKFTKKSRFSGNMILVSVPGDSDKMIARIEPLFVKDQLFTDNLQDDYQFFYNKMDKDYLAWQKNSFYQVKAEEAAKKQAQAQAFAGALLMVAGAAAASNSNNSYTGYAAGYGAMAAGAGFLAKSSQTSKQAKIIKDGIDELGKDLSISMAPSVIEMEDKIVELSGDASEQYQQWRKILKDIYDQQKAPEVYL